MAKRGLVGDLALHAGAGNEHYASVWAEAQATEDRLDDAIAVPRPFMSGGSKRAASQLISLLLRHGREKELDDEVAAGTPGAVYALRHDACGGDAVRRAWRWLMGMTNRTRSHR